MQYKVLKNLHKKVQNINMVIGNDGLVGIPGCLHKKNNRHPPTFLEILPINKKSLSEAFFLVN